jgi:hypothetical protein
MVFIDHYEILGIAQIGTEKRLKHQQCWVLSTNN